MKKQKEVAKKNLCDLFIEEKRKKSKKAIKARIKIYKEYLYPAVHRTGFVYFSTLDNALDALTTHGKILIKHGR